VWHYEATVDGARVPQAGEGHDLKAAAAGLGLGGGRSDLRLKERLRRPGPPCAAADFGDTVESLGGRYITAEDVGIAAEDLVAIGERTSHLTGLPPDHGGSGDPSPSPRSRRGRDTPAPGSASLTGPIRPPIVLAGLGRVGSNWPGGWPMPAPSWPSPTSTWRSGLASEQEPNDRTLG
jgi:hypothetical protein